MIAFATRNLQLATRNLQLATRNLQLATRNSQLALYLVPPPFTPTQYVYLDFNLNVPIPWRCIPCLGV